MPKPNIPIAENPWGKKLYVRSCLPTATDSNNDGQRAHSPLLTIKRAIELAADYDTIIVGEDHIEVVSEPWVIKKCVEVQCRGRGCHRPLFSFVKNGAIAVEADGFTMYNARSDLGGVPYTDRVASVHQASYVDLGHWSVPPATSSATPTPEPEPVEGEPSSG